MLKKMLLLSAASLLLVPAAVADHGHLPKRVRVAQLAFELHDATLQLESDAFRRARHGRRYDPVVLDAIDRLEDRARRFERSVKRGRDPYVLERDLDRLRRSFRNVAREMRFVRSQRLRADFAEVSWLMERLDRKVARAAFRDRRGPRPVYRGSRGSIRYGDRDRDIRVDW